MSTTLAVFGLLTSQFGNLVAKAIRTLHIQAAVTLAQNGRRESSVMCFDVDTKSFKWLHCHRNPFIEPLTCQTLTVVSSGLMS